MPLFTIIIPTYNRSEKLKIAIQSVVSQTFRDFELLVIDDGSTDNTKNIVKDFSDSRIIYYWQKNSGGPASPRNFGIDNARGDWVCFLDSDDLWYPSKLQVVANEIYMKPKTDLFCHNEILVLVHNAQKKLLRHGPYSKDFYRQMLIYNNRVSTSAATVKKEFLNKHKLRFNETKDYVIVEDYDLWLRIAFNGGIFYFINKPLGEYIIENDNLTTDNTRHIRNQRIVQKQHAFNIQNFESNKNRIWKKIEVGLLLSELGNSINEKKVKEIFFYSLILIKSPFFLVNHIVAWIVRKKYQKFG